MTRPIKYYTDEHIARVVVGGLRQRGIDVLTVPDAGMLGATDEEHIEFARGQERVFATQDQDFLRIHASGIDHAGIVFIRSDASPRDMIRGLLMVAQVLDASEMERHLEFI